jgi:hypothetical protein
MRLWPTVHLGLRLAGLTLSSSPVPPSLPFDIWSFGNRAAGLIIETIFYNIIDREIGLIAMMEFELLRSFVAVAECGGFHRAAEQLNLTQSTVSQQIKRLEFETKRPLFRRTTRTVALTDDGEICWVTRAACCNWKKWPPPPYSAATFWQRAPWRRRGSCRWFSAAGTRPVCKRASECEA